MTARIQQIRADARRRLHREMSVPALYLVDGAEPVPVNVRIHDKQIETAGMGSADGAELRDIATIARFWREELALPARRAVLSLGNNVAYRIGDALEHDNETIDARVSRIPDAQAALLPAPEAV